MESRGFPEMEPEGFAEISRGLSAAIPPDLESTKNRTPVGVPDIRRPVTPAGVMRRNAVSDRGCAARPAANIWNPSGVLERSMYVRTRWIVSKTDARRPKQGCKEQSKGAGCGQAAP